MNRQCKFPSNFWPLLFLLAAVVGLLNTPTMRELRAEKRIQRQFERALAAFDGERMEFTIDYQLMDKIYYRSSDQLTPQQRQSAQNFVRTLQYERPCQFDEEGNAIGGPLGGVRLSVNYSLPTGETIRASAFCWFEKKDGKRLRRNFYESMIYRGELIDIFTTRYREELLNSSEFST